MAVTYLAKATWKEVNLLRSRNVVVLLPAGSCEQHGPHLPMETDSVLVSEMCCRGAKQAARRKPDLDLLVLPTLTIGRSPHHMDYPGSLSLRASTYINMVEDVCHSIARHGFIRILIVNGHGANADYLRVAARNVRDTVECLVGVVSYWSVARESINQLRKTPVGGICHAGEMETACMLYLDEKAVRKDLMKKAIPRPISSRVVLDLVNEGVTINHNVRDFSEDGTLGDPTVGSPELGEAFLKVISDELAKLIDDFSRWELGHLRKD